MNTPIAEASLPRPESRSRAHALLFVMTLIWAVNFSVTKLALAELSPLAFNALRFPLASLVLFLALRTRGPLIMPQRADIARVLLLGGLGNSIYQICFIFGMANTRAGIASLLLAGTPLLTALLSASLGHERVERRVWAGLVCTLAGITMVVASSAASHSGDTTLVGDLLLLGASISWAFYTVGSKPLVAKYGALPVTAWTLWSGTIGIVLMGIPALAQADISAIEPSMWGAILYAGCLSIGFAYVIWYNGVKLLGNARTSVYSNLVPVLAMGVAWLWLAEVPSAGQMVGAGVIIGGVSLAQWK